MASERIEGGHNDELKLLEFKFDMCSKLCIRLPVNSRLFSNPDAPP